MYSLRLVKFLFIFVSIILIIRFLLTNFPHNPHEANMESTNPYFELNSVENETFLTLDKCACFKKHRKLKRNHKIISYSYYLNPKEKSSQRYGTNFISILTQAKLLYPKWTIRIYTNVTTLLESTCNLCKSYHNIFKWYWVDGNLANRSNGEFWRFMPIGDENVDLFISRDLDSPLSFRERLAVMEWENSDKVVHIMRDHPMHNVSILAGMWGFKNSLVGKRARELLKNLMVEKSLEDTRKGHDQFILESELLPRFTQNSIISHDSYHCGQKRFLRYGKARSFVLQRIGNEFVGDYMIAKGPGLGQPCPIICRPNYGKNWTYC